MKFDGYDTGGFFDEMFSPDSSPRQEAKALVQRLQTLPDGELQRRQRAAERALLQLGITFNVYGDAAGTERIFPFDVVPRVVGAAEWDRIERGLKQRIQALNLFLDDLYHDQKIIKDGVVPEEVIKSAKSFRAQCVGLDPPRGIWCHITGTDLVRDGDGQVYVLEDNLRCPSGVSYVMENRQVMKRTFPQLFEATRIRPVVDYPSRLLEMLEIPRPGQRAVAARGRADAGHLQLGVLRAFVSRAADGRGTGRRPGPGRFRRLGGDAHDERLRARRRDLPPDRR
jgi:uncharacterized circularly permuted ATP-grasp superfamily protein